MRKVKTMAREIKFRAWSKVEEEMVYGIDLTTQDGTAHPINGNWDNIMSLDERVELMQYTGLKDKNNVEIYEGDIFGIDNIDGGIEATGKVVFDQDFAQFTIQYTNGGWAELWQHLQENKNQAREVIGNIYENPDLLKGEPNE